MMRLLSTLLLLTLASCSGAFVPGPAPAPILGEVRQTSHIEGQGVFGSITLNTMPMTFPAKWLGRADVTWVVSALGGRVYFDGDADFILEPITPPDLATLNAMLADGRLIVHKAGQPAGISPIGTIR